MCSGGDLIKYQIRQIARIYLQMRLEFVCLSVCVCVCVCVWMSRIRFAISAPIVSPLGSFSSSRRRAFCDPSFHQISVPAPNTVQKCNLLSLSADCSKRSSSAAASVRAARVSHWQGSDGRSQAAGSSFFGLEARGKFDLAHCQ